MSKKSHQANDSAWKDILDFCFKEFVELCLPIYMSSLIGINPIKV